MHVVGVRATPDRHLTGDQPLAVGQAFLPALELPDHSGAPLLQHLNGIGVFGEIVALLGILFQVEELLRAGGFLCIRCKLVWSDGLSRERRGVGE